MGVLQLESWSPDSVYGSFQGVKMKFKRGLARWEEKEHLGAPGKVCEQQWPRDGRGVMSAGPGGGSP